MCGRDRRPLVQHDDPVRRTGATVGAQRRDLRPMVATGCDDVDLGSGIGQGRERPIHARGSHRQGVVGVGRGAHRGAVVAGGAHHDRAGLGDAAQGVLHDFIGRPRQGVRQAEIDDLGRPGRPDARVVLQSRGVEQALRDVVAGGATLRDDTDRHDRHPRAVPRPSHAGHARAVAGVRGDDAGDGGPVPQAVGRGIGGVGVEAVAVMGGSRVADEVVAGIRVEVAQQVRVRDVAGVQHRYHHGRGSAQHARRERVPHLRQPDLPQRPLPVVRTTAVDGVRRGGVTRIVGNRRPARQRRHSCLGRHLRVEAGHARGSHAEAQDVASRRKRTRRSVGLGRRIQPPVRLAVEGHLHCGDNGADTAPYPERRVCVLAQQHGPMHRQCRLHRHGARHEQRGHGRDDKQSRNPSHDRT